MLLKHGERSLKLAPTGLGYPPHYSLRGRSAWRCTFEKGLCMTSSQTHLSTQLEALGKAYMGELLRQIDKVTEVYAPSGTSLGPMIDYHMSTGGKRLRALLPLAVAQTLGTSPELLVPFGAACELLHNATLVHDDLQDGDTMRRGKPTVWARFGAERAINLGDAMLYLTLALIEQLAMPVEARYKISLQLVQETLRVIDGQEREFLLKEIEHPSLEDYVQMVEGKTSGLFSLPIAGAAALCGAAPEIVSGLQVASRHLGVVFQIQDDILDIYGDKGREQRGSDIAEGKISMLVIHTLHHASEADARWLRALLKRERAEVSQDDVERAISVMEACGAKEAAFQEMDRRVAEALAAPGLEGSPALQTMLSQLASVFLAPVEGAR